MSLSRAFKMRLHRQISYLAVLVCIGLPVQAQDASAVDGLGTRTCAAVLEARDTDKNLYFALASWVNGYVTAANGYEADTFDLTPWQTPEFTMAQIANSCAANKDAKLAQVVVAYVRYLKASRLQKPSPLVSVGNDKIKTFVYQDVLRQLKARLDAAGLDTGDKPATEYGTAFQNAVVSYQSQNGLRVTGLPDIATLAHALGRSN